MTRSPEDAERTFKEAAAQQDRNKACEQRQLEDLDRARATEVKADQMRAALRDIILQCRQEVLDARDRLLDAMSPEGFAALSAWVDARRATMSVVVPKDEWDFFRLPR